MRTQASVCVRAVPPAGGGGAGWQRCCCGRGAPRRGRHAPTHPLRVCVQLWRLRRVANGGERPHHAAQLARGQHAQRRVQALDGGGGKGRGQGQAQPAGRQRRAVCSVSASGKGLARSSKELAALEQTLWAGAAARSGRAGARHAPLHRQWLPGSLHLANEYTRSARSTGAALLNLRHRRQGQGRRELLLHFWRATVCAEEQGVCAAWLALPARSHVRTPAHTRARLPSPGHARTHAPLPPPPHTHENTRAVTTHFVAAALDTSLASAGPRSLPDAAAAVVRRASWTGLRVDTLRGGVCVCGGGAHGLGAQRQEASKAAGEGAGGGAQQAVACRTLGTACATAVMSTGTHEAKPHTRAAPTPTRARACWPAWPCSGPTRPRRWAGPGPPAPTRCPPRHRAPSARGRRRRGRRHQQRRCLWRWPASTQ